MTRFRADRGRHNVVGSLPPWATPTGPRRLQRAGPHYPSCAPVHAVRLHNRARFQPSYLSFLCATTFLGDLNAHAFVGFGSSLPSYCTCARGCHAHAPSDVDARGAARRATHMLAPSSTFCTTSLAQTHPRRGVRRILSTRTGHCAAPRPPPEPRACGPPRSDAPVVPLVAAPPPASAAVGAVAAGALCGRGRQHGVRTVRGRERRTVQRARARGARRARAGGASSCSLCTGISGVWRCVWMWLSTWRASGDPDAARRGTHLNTPEACTRSPPKTASRRARPGQIAVRARGTVCAEPSQGDGGTVCAEPR